MFFKKVKDFIKISFNCEKSICDAIEEIKDDYFCTTTDVINEALREYIKRYYKKKSRLK